MLRLHFTFNEKSDMESMTVSAHYTTGEILKKAGLNTILGMGTVFVVLIFISFIIYLLGFIPKLQKKLSGKGKAAEEKKGNTCTGSSGTCSICTTGSRYG